MMPPRIASSLLALCLGLSATTSIWAEENDKEDEREQVISIDQVPDAAKAALLSHTVGLVISRVEMEEENGVTTYEATAATSGGQIEVTVDATGKVIEIESGPAEGDESDEDGDEDGDHDNDEQEDGDQDEQDDGEHEHEGEEDGEH